MRQISLRELKAKLERGDKFILINALDQARFDSMHIPGSVNLFSKEDVLRYLKRDDEIVVYCTEETCNRSINLYFLLNSMGFTNVRRFAGGLREWVEDGNPTSTNMLWNIVPIHRASQLRKAQ